MAKKKKKRGLIISLVTIAVTGTIVLIGAYQIFLAPNVVKDGFIYIPTGATYKQVQDSLTQNNFLKSPSNFNGLAKIKDYYKLVKPGRYELRRGMSNRDLINRLRGGMQTPVKVTFNNVRTLEQLASRISTMIEADSASLMDAFSNEDFLAQNQLNIHTVKSIFIPNTYELWWNTSADKFLHRMTDEHQKFWTEDRINKAKERGLTPVQVSVLASIVEEETKKNDEKPNVASVYLNRMRKGMPLQADPTVKYAVGDFGLKRILNVHLKTESPYNTYMNKDLPPGPICLPAISSIESVLNASETNYLYFCAKADFSGYHCFAETYNQHLKNARAYWNALSYSKN